jgi:YesN/AraC family two-component response regulator
LIFIEDVDGREQVVETYPYELGKELIKNIKNIDADKSNDIIKQIMDFLRKSAFSYQHARQFLIQLFGMVIMAIKDMGYEVSEVFGERSLYREMEQQEDIEDMYEWINSICNDVITFLNNARKSQSKDIARLAKEYIDHQLTDVDLSLASVAESLYVSDSYLSRIFKEELGVNFFDYITQQRIKKAKELLATTDMNVNEIAAGVGMSVQSFIRNFKKYEGITPGKYREKFNLDKDVNSIL